jgi:membrane-associated phospholipid phosphatase
VNETVKKEIYTERSPRQLHIDNYLRYAPAAAVYGLNAAGIHGTNNFRDRTIIYGMSTLIMGATVLSVKKITGETRPDGSDDCSFPSGHTATAFASAEFLRQEYKNVSPWYGIAGYAAAAATGYLRISNNRHWMGDVVAGAGVGIMSTKLAYWIYPVIKRKFFKDKEVSTIVMPSYQNGTLGLGMVHHF